MQNTDKTIFSLSRYLFCLFILYVVCGLFLQVITHADYCFRSLIGKEKLALIRSLCSDCFVSSLYRVYVVALGSDPERGDSPPSNLLTLCTPVVQDSIMGRRPSGGIIRPPFDVTVNVLSTSNTSIAIEWVHPSERGKEMKEQKEKSRLK